MAGFTARDLRTTTPDPKAVTAAGGALEKVRQELLKAAHHLDASPTRSLHREVLELKDRADNLAVNLTEFVGE